MALASKSRRRTAGGMSDGEGMSLSLSREYSKRSKFQYFGWIYHLSSRKLSQAHLRFLFIRGKSVEMYKRDPHENPGIKPIRQGVVGPSFMVEDLGCRKINNSDMYVLRFFNRLDKSKKGEIGCTTAEEAQKWMNAFEQAKQEADYELSSRGSTRDKLNMETEINLDAHRHRVRKYAYGFIKLIRIGQGPETLTRQSSSVSDDVKTDGYLGADDDADAIEAHTWKCVCTMNGIRIFEDVSDPKVSKSVLVKSVGIVDASADCVFEILMSLDPSKRYEWDMLTSDLELVESLDGSYDVVYGTFDPKYFTWWYSKRDFVLSRQWFRGQNGTYTLLQLPVVHKNRPPRSGYQRTKMNPSTWEVKDLSGSTATESPRCLLTHMLEIQYESWSTWKKNRSSKFEKSIPYALLCLVAGIREYVGANPGLANQCASSVFDSKSSGVGDSRGKFYDAGVDEFYDAIGVESSDDEDSDKDAETEEKDQEMPKSENFCSEETPVAPTKDSEGIGKSDSTISSVQINQNQFSGSLPQGKDDNGANCWTNPGGEGFMIRGKTYLKDYAKVRGGDPFLKLIAVDWLKSEHSLDKVALRPSCVVQSEAGKALPFIFIVNLQIPAKPEYNMVFYYAADRPISDDSLLGKFIKGSDAFRDSRFKLIPSIVKGYWMVKRAVGSKACLLGKAVTCRYLRQDNFLEIDVDIGSSSVARSVISLVLGYVTNLVVDLAILVQAQEEDELPEFLLGTVQLNCIRLDSALEA